MTTSDKATARRLRFNTFLGIAGLSPGHPGYLESLKAHENLSQSPKYRQRLKEHKDRAVALAMAFLLNGPGLFANSYLRKLLLEYNNRVFHGFGAEQPTSFSVMRSFIEPDDRALVLRILDECFYQCDLDDYLDFITGGAILQKIVDPYAFEELKSYEFNSVGAFSQIILPDFGEFVFCGAAMVREESELSIVGIFGHKSANYDPKSLKDFGADSILPSKRELFRRTGADGQVDFSAEPLFDNADYYPVLALTRIDLNEMKIQVQHLMFEAKGAFRVVTDDPTAYYDENGNLLSPQVLEIKENALRQLAAHRHIFDFLYHFVHFSEFVRANEDDFYVERHPTQIKLQNDPSIKGIKRTVQRLKSSAVEPQYRPLYREVLTLRPRITRAIARTLETLELRRETSGFWKMLSFEKTGADKNGNRIQGKSWVTKELTWNESPSRPSDQLALISITPQPNSQEIGYVYVMRSPMHERNIYKIGFTNRNPEDRAGDLSASSGQPDHLVVVQSWKVLDARRIEQAIHRRLGEFRLTDRREFFKVKFERARSVIEETIAEMKAGQSS